MFRIPHENVDLLICNDRNLNHFLIIINFFVPNKQLEIKTLKCKVRKFIIIFVFLIILFFAQVND